MKIFLAISATLFLCACSPAIKPEKSLYDKLGGKTGIYQISYETIDKTAHNPNTSRSFKDVKLATLTESLANFLCIKTGGNCVYEGETMKKSHQDLHITTAEFELMVQILRDTLDRQHVSNADKNALLKILAPMKKDIVNP